MIDTHKIKKIIRKSSLNKINVMKKIITSLCLGLMFIFAAFSESKADVYYVLDGNNLVLKPAGAILFEYQWTLDGGVTEKILGTLDGGKYTHKFGTGVATAVSKHTIALEVLDGLGGCLSTLVSHTVIVLPKITISLATTNNKDNFCKDLAFATDLTATINLDLAAMNLGTYNVELNPLTWTKNGVGISDIGSVLRVTTAGTYEVFGTYKLPTTGNYAVTAEKLSGAISGTSKIISNTLDLPTVPLLQLVD